MHAKRVPSTVLHLANKPSPFITDEEIKLIVGAVAEDPRVGYIMFSHRDDCGTPMCNCEIEDTCEGWFAGTYSIGRILAAISETRAEHVERIARIEAERAAAAAKANLPEIRHWTPKEARGHLVKNGISVSWLLYIRSKLEAGKHCSEAEIDGWLTYERDIVQGQPRPMELFRYL